MHQNYRIYRIVFVFLALLVHCKGKTPAVPLAQLPLMRNPGWFPTMGYRLPLYWNAPFLGMVDPFLIRKFDPTYSPWTWSAPPSCDCKPSFQSNWGTDKTPPEGKMSLTRTQSTQQLCQKPFYMDIHSVCNRDYRCTKDGPYVWDDQKKHYVCTNQAIQKFQEKNDPKNPQYPTENSEDVPSMYCSS